VPLALKPTYRVVDSFPSMQLLSRMQRTIREVIKWSNIICPGGQGATLQSYRLLILPCRCAEELPSLVLSLAHVAQVAMLRSKRAVLFDFRNK
jgi:hypothetical protein